MRTMHLVAQDDFVPCTPTSSLGTALETARHDELPDALGTLQVGSQSQSHTRWRLGQQPMHHEYTTGSGHTLAQDVRCAVVVIVQHGGLR